MSLKILAIDDGPRKLEQRVYGPMREALAAKNITLEYRMVANYEEAIETLKSGFRPDAITQDYFIPQDHGHLRGGESGPYHLNEILEYIDDNMPGYKPQPFMLTYSTSDSAVAINQLERLKKHGTQVISPTDMSWAISNLKLPDIHPLEHPSAFSRYLQQRFGQDIITFSPEPLYEAPELKGLEKVLSEPDLYNALPNLDFSDMTLRKSLSPDVSDGEEASTHRVECLKSNYMPVNGYAAFNAGDVERLLSEDKKPVLFIQDYNVDVHGPLLSKVAGVVCLGVGGSHLLEKGIPTVSKAKKEIWDEKTGVGIDLCRIEQTSGGAAVVNNSHAVIRAVSDHPKGSTTAPEPEYEKKNKVILFKAGDKVTLARTAAYKGHLYIQQPELKSILGKTQELVAAVPFKRPKFLANLSANTDFKDTADATARVLRAGADGIGLVRTEYMLDSASLKSVKEGIIHNDPAKYACLSETDSINGALVAAFSSGDEPRPIRIRLFDFPPDEFFSADELKQLKSRVGDVASGTPLALATDGLYEAQLKAIFSKAKRDYKITLQIIAPHISSAAEMQKVRWMAENAAEACGFPREHFQIGAMMETVASCKPAEASKIAKLCDFASFGTNDLTQEITRTLRSYNGEGVNPYVTLDNRVKDVMKQATKAMRSSNPRIKISCCGGQMRDLDSLMFCAKDLGMEEISVPGDAFHLIGRQLQMIQQLREQKSIAHAEAVDGKNASTANRQR